MLEKDRGRLELENEAIAGPSDKLVAGNEHISLVHQNLELHPYLTLEESIRAALAAYTEEYQAERIQELLEMAGLEESKTAYPRQLSGGQQQKAAILIALADPPKLLLLDEPFSHLDPFSKQEFLQRIKLEASEIGTTIIFVTHDTRDAMLFGDRLMMIHQGRILQDGSAHDIYARPISPLVAEFFGPVAYFSKAEIAKYWGGNLSNTGSQIGVRPEAIYTATSGPGAKVTQCLYLGSHFMVRATLDHKGFYFNSKTAIDPGSVIPVRLDFDQLLVFPQPAP